MAGAPGFSLILMSLIKFFGSKFVGWVMDDSLRDDVQKIFTDPY